MGDRGKKAAALRYRQGVDAAPAVIASGKGSVAERIIAVAREHHIPLHEDRNLVEVLSALPLYDDIPEELYRAVAEVLAFIYRMSGELHRRTVQKKPPENSR